MTATRYFMYCVVGRSEQSLVSNIQHKKMLYSVVLPITAKRQFAIGNSPIGYLNRE